MEHQTLGRRFVCPIGPATQREFILDWRIFYCEVQFSSCCKVALITCFGGIVKLYLDPIFDPSTHSPQICLDTFRIFLVSFLSLLKINSSILLNLNTKLPRTVLVPDHIVNMFLWMFDQPFYLFYKVRNMYIVDVLDLIKASSVWEN